MLIRPRIKLAALILVLSSSTAFSVYNPFYSGPGYNGDPGSTYRKTPAGHYRARYRYVHKEYYHRPSWTVPVTTKSGTILWLSKENHFNERAQAFINRLEGLGYTIPRDDDTGGWRPGHCDIPRHKHMCGLAFDLCQTDRNHVTCKLPPNQELEALAREYGMISGSIWYDGDRGHFEDATIATSWGKGPPLVYSVKKFLASLVSKTPKPVASLAPPLGEPVTIKPAPIAVAARNAELTVWPFANDVRTNYVLGIGYMQIAGR